MSFKNSVLLIAFSLLSYSSFAMNADQITQLLHQNIQTEKPSTGLKNTPNSPLAWQEVKMPLEESGMHIVQMKEEENVLFAFRSYKTNGWPSSRNLLRSLDAGATWENRYLPDNSPVLYLESLDANHLILVSMKDIYLSDDRGEHWHSSSQGINLKEKVYGIQVVDPQTIYLLMDRHNVYRSINGGHSWAPASFGLPKKESYNALAARDELMLVGFNNEHRDEAGLYLSTNRGEYWQQPSSNWKVNDIRSVAINSQHAIFVIANFHLYKTDIEGKTWIQLDKNLSSPESFKIDDQDRLYLLYSDFPSLLYRSSDNGDTWELIKNFEDKNDKYFSIDGFTLLKSGKIIAYNNASTYISDETQRNYSTINMPAQFITSMAADKSNLVIISDSVYHSPDGGKNWSINKNTTQSYTISVTKFKNTFVLSNSKGQVLASKDKGNTWEEIYNMGNGHEMALHSNKNRLWLISDICCDKFFSCCYMPDAYLTEDLHTWQNVNPKQYTPSMYAEDKVIYLTNGHILKKSTDGGLTWEILLTILDGTSQKVRSYGQKTVVVAIDKAGLIKSTDGGENWILINNGLTSWYFSEILLLDENNYLVTTMNGVFHTTNGGKTWMPANQGLKNVYTTGLYLGEDTLYVSTKGSGVYKAQI